MRNLSKRLARLEVGNLKGFAIVPFLSRTVQLAAVERCLLPILSPEDRIVWHHDTPPSHDDPAWSRLSEAFNRAAVEAKQPFVMSIADHWGCW